MKEFLEVAFRHVGLEWQKYVEIDPKYFRPAEVELLIGDPAHATRVLGWKPATTLESLCDMMVKADLRRNEQGFSF